MGYFFRGNVGDPSRRWAEIGVGAGDLELAREVVQAQGALVAAAPPEAEAVYVCGWCFRTVLRSELNHEDTVSGACVCDECVAGKQQI